MNTDATQTETNPPAPRNNRSNNFNALRFLLSASVIFGHSYLLYGAPLREPFTLLTRRQAAAGDLAVDGFFIISGFLILQSWRASKTASDYFRKRVLRIYPGYLVCALLCIFLVGPLGAGAARYFETMPWKESLLGLPFLSLLNLQTFVNSPVPNVNSSLWTISIEFACYIFVAILGLLGASRDRPSTLAAFLDRRFVLAAFLAAFLLSTIQRLFHWETHLVLPLQIGGRLNDWPRLFTFFIAGMFFHLYADRIHYTRRGALIAALVLGASCLVRVLPQTLPLFGTYLLFYIAFLPEIRLQDFGRKTDLSYGIYLYGWPVQQLLLKYFPNAFSPLTLFAAALPLTCACAYASWHLVEKPFLKLKPRPVKVLGETAR